MSASDTYTERDGSEIAQYESFAVEFRPQSHRYWVHQEGARYSVPSVTGILKVLDKPALLRWYEKKGAEGTAQLVQTWQRYAREELAQGQPAGPVLQGLLLALDEITLEPVDAVELVRDRRLGADAQRDKGASRGTLIHDMQEAYVRTGSPPKLSDFDPEDRGFVQGYCKWLLFARPEPIACEKRVASVRHGYAGTLDLHARAYYRCDSRLVSFARGNILADLKTSTRGGVWPEHGFQLLAYDLANVECGAEPTDALVVIGLSEDGEFTDRVVRLASTDWINVLAAYKSMQRAKQWLRDVA